MEHGLDVQASGVPVHVQLEVGTVASYHPFRVWYFATEEAIEARE